MGTFNLNMPVVLIAETEINFPIIGIIYTNGLSFFIFLSIIFYMFPPRDPCWKSSNKLHLTKKNIPFPDPRVSCLRTFRNMAVRFEAHVVLKLPYIFCIVSAKLHANLL